MKAGKTAAVFLISVCMLSFAGCGSTQTEKPDLTALGQITAIAREEGSGTRSQFESLLDTAESGVSAVASSTEEAVQMVSDDRSAIGYAAMSSLSGAEGAKALSIGGITPSEETVKSGKYPLTRNWYLAFQEDPSDLVREFVTFARGAGQKYVEGAAVPVAKETTFLSLKPAGTLRISGSTSMTPLIRTLADAYEKYNPNAEIEIEETDSAKGLTDVMQGKADLAMSSRDLKDYEKELLSYRAIAADGIVILVNSENPLEDLSLRDLKKIYDGEVHNWSDL